ncbi:MAG: hypothetical protein ACRDFS_01150 [Chloroflexota bacterium]
MIRAVGYLLASAVVWFAEGYVFSTFLHFSLAQNVTLAIIYAVLFAVAVWLLLRFAVAQDENLASWRYLSLAPMLVAIVGSFVSILLVVLVAASGSPTAR